MPVSLKNNTNRLQVFTLAHEQLRDAPAPYGYVVHSGAAVSTDMRNGTRLVTPVQKAVPTSITFEPHETRHNLPRILKECSEISTAINARPKVLSVVADAPDAV